MNFNFSINPYHPLSYINPVACAICTAASLKITHLFLQVARQQKWNIHDFRLLKISLVCTLELGALLGSTFFPLASSVVFTASCIAFVASKRFLPFFQKKTEAVESSEPKKVDFPNIFNQSNDLMKAFAAQQAVIQASADPLAPHVKEASQQAEEIKCKMAQLLQDNPEVPIFEFFATFDAMLSFVKEHKFKKLNLSKSFISSSELLTIVKELDLEYLDLSNCFQFDNHTLEELIDYCPNLTHLNLSDTLTRNETFNKIASHLSRLKYLNLSKCTLIEQPHLKNIAQLTSLRHLDIAKCSADNTVATAIAQHLPHLTHLNLSQCQGIGKKGLQEIAIRLKNLKVLNLFNCQVDDTFIKILATHVKKLVSLNIGSCAKITLEGFTCLAKNLKLLKTLDISSCEQVNTAILKEIVKFLPAITSLNLSTCTRVDNECIRAIATSLPDLLELDISHCPLLDSTALKFISGNLKKLQLLNIRSCPLITPIEIGDYAGQLPNLTSLFFI